MERGGILHSWVILCLGTRLAESQDTKSLTRARYLLFPFTRDGTSISLLDMPSPDDLRGRSLSINARKSLHFLQLESAPYMCWVGVWHVHHREYGNNTTYHRNKQSTQDLIGLRCDRLGLIGDQFLPSFNILLDHMSVLPIQVLFPRIIFRALLSNYSIKQLNCIILQ